MGFLKFLMIEISPILVYFQLSLIIFDIYSILVIKMFCCLSN